MVDNITDVNGGAVLHELLPVKGLIILLYAIILICSVCGNTLVIFVVASNSVMQTVTNLFITNLAVSDLTQTLTSLWVTPAYVYLESWHFGWFTCYLVTSMQGMSIFISSFTLSAIAIDRYIVIMYPFRSRITICTCLGIMLLIWALAFLFTLPVLMHMETVHNVTNEPKCEDSLWPDPQVRKLYGLGVMILQYGMTFAVTAFCYARIVKHLRVTSSHIQSARSAERQAVEAKRKQRLNQMLIMMVVIFGCCWLAWNCLNIVRDFTAAKIDSKPWFVFCYLLAHILAMSSTMWNPLLYAWKNENFKREFMAVLPCFTKIKRVPRHRSGPNLLLTRPSYDVIDLSNPEEQNQNLPFRKENIKMKLLSQTAEEE